MQTTRRDAVESRRTGAPLKVLVTTSEGQGARASDKVMERILGEDSSPEFVWECAVDLMAVASVFPTGTVLERRGDHICRRTGPRDVHTSANV
jgi:hypothetical protein